MMNKTCLLLLYFFSLICWKINLNTYKLKKILPIDHRRRLVDFIPAGQFIFYAWAFRGDKEVSYGKTNVFNWLSWAKCESWLFNSQGKIQVFFLKLCNLHEEDLVIQWRFLIIS